LRLREQVLHPHTLLFPTTIPFPPQLKNQDLFYLFYLFYYAPFFRLFYLMLFSI